MTTLKIPISESDIEMFKDLVNNNDKFDWDFPDSEGNMVNIQFIQEPEDEEIYDANYQKLIPGDRVVLINIDDEEIATWYETAPNILKIKNIDINAEVFYVIGREKSIDAVFALKVEIK